MKPKEFWALRDITFEVGKGEIVSLIGPNGCGKSTLLQIVSGILQPTTGRIVTRGRLAALLELGAGFNPEFTGRENVFLNGEILGFSPAEIARMLPGIEEFAGIGDFIDRPVKEYSSGMYVRLAFATAIHVDPDILIVDEALAVGDAIFANRCIRKFEELKEKGVTILFVSHDLGLVKQLSHRAVFLLNGRIEAIGAPKDVIDRYIGMVLERQKSDREKSPRSTALRSSFRHGDGSSEVLDVQLVDEEGRASLVFLSGQMMSIRIRTRYHRPTVQPMVGVLIRTRIGIDVYGTNTRVEKFDTGTVEPGEEIEINFKFRCDLTPQQYTLTVATQNPDGSSHDWLDDVLAFDVVSERQAAGLVDLRSPNRLARSQSRNRTGRKMKLAEIQLQLRQSKLDGWLFFDHHQRDPLAYRILGLGPRATSAGAGIFLSLPMAKCAGWCIASNRRCWTNFRAKSCATLHGRNKRRELRVYSARRDGSRCSIRRIARSPMCRWWTPARLSWCAPREPRSRVPPNWCSTSRPVWTRRRANRTSRRDGEWIPSAARLSTSFAKDCVRSRHVGDRGPRLYSGALCRERTDYRIRPDRRRERPCRRPALRTDGRTLPADSQRRFRAARYVGETRPAGFRILRHHLDRVLRRGTTGGIREVFEIVRDARNAGIHAVQSAVSNGARFAVLKWMTPLASHITSQGYANAFVHRTGHSIGQEIHGSGANMDNFETHDERRIIPGLASRSSRDLPGQTSASARKSICSSTNERVRHRRDAGRACFDGLKYYFSVSAATPGSSIPERNSSEAPPPVETCEILSVTPALLMAFSESPPPTTDTAPDSATALAIATVPLSNGGFSNTPIGPFQMIVFAPAMILREVVDGFGADVETHFAIRNGCDRFVLGAFFDFAMQPHGPPAAQSCRRTVSVSCWPVLICRPPPAICRRAVPAT